MEVVEWEETKVLEGLKNDGGKNLFRYRMDVLWYHIGNMEIPVTNAKHFKLSPKVAEIVLIRESLFNIVNEGEFL